MIILIQDLLVTVDHKAAAGAHHPADLRRFYITEERAFLDREHQVGFAAEVFISALFTQFVVALDGSFDVCLYGVIGADHIQKFIQCFGTVTGIGRAQVMTLYTFSSRCQCIVKFFLRIGQILFGCVG